MQRERRLVGVTASLNSRLQSRGSLKFQSSRIKAPRPATVQPLDKLAVLVFFFSVRFIAVVAQYFEVQVYDQFAIRGNAAIFKCQVPSFVADHVDVVGWIDSNGGSYVADGQSYGINPAWSTDRNISSHASYNFHALWQR